METREDILKELKEIAPKLAAMDKTNPYTVPQDYFLNFKDVMLQQVGVPVTALDELRSVAPGLSKIEKQAAAEMPANYFTDFSSQLLNKIRANEVATELAVVAPSLAGIEKVNALQIPANYFSSFPERMLKLVQAEQMETAPTSARLSINKILDRIIVVVSRPKYSAAFAGLASVLIIAVMMLLKTQANDPDTQLNAQLAALSTEEISSYLDNKSDAYTDNIFESNFDEKMITAGEKASAIHVYKDALQDVDDATLNDAIAD
ncbi:MAG: hypothetical protein JWO06_3056 [Bacteroidota bacterium]|nr:hypothetical protein [Bacteroidota bacterium]